jgi:uncharacterized membrane protein YdbT with pleckstrin-like domain
MLKPGEKILYKARIHRFCYVLPLFLLAAGGLVTASPGLQAQPDSPLYAYEQTLEHIIDTIKGIIPERVWPYLVTFQAFRTNYLGLLLLVLGGTQFVSAFLHRNFSRYWITDRRVIAQTSLFRRHLQEIALDRVSHVTMNYGAIGRQIGRAMVLVHDNGMREIEIKNLSKPRRFKENLEAAASRFTKAASQ